ncbi:carbohydrate-binding domain-containing protein [Candidatus Saccharibacteria bacterium]|nr:carbohydrate-binding domain-containing protein [Candidatus Saccharibacteria bacterium]
MNEPEKPLNPSGLKTNTPSKKPTTLSEKPEKPSRKLLEILTLVFVPVAIIVVCLLFFNNKDNGLKNNIDDSSVAWSTYDEQEITLSESLEITTPGIYTLTGSLSDGMIEINTPGIVKLVLNNASIVNSSGPAILVSEAETVFIETAEGTTNYLSDSTKYNLSDDDIKATLFSKDDLVLQGSGKLVVTGNFEDGIVSKDDLKITSGTYEINSKDEGIRGRDSVYIAGGTFDIVSGGDAIKSNNSDEIGKGTVLIDSGEITISAGDDGIHAESSTEINGGKIDIKKSYEGIEGSTIKITGGEISVVSSDDGLNAAGGNDSSSPNTRTYQSSSSNYWIEINGGTIHVDSAGDGIDSNGSLTINGGTVIVDGPANSANGALDSETDVVYNGGTIIAVGASGMAVAPGNKSSGYSISAFLDKTYSAGTTISVKNSAGENVLSYAPIKSFSHLSLSSPEFKEGETYTIFLNDSEYESVTLSEKTTRVGFSIEGQMMPGGGFRR